ncbi:hypothetical protein DSO57_1031414 [Entomophthora muscae]|uniref:Uncharacterized protein n=1 Tax=Entomophthora muscae TaxID=34485 RepID=A0ACC2TN17_9FUNG|nr:hypothetical protein DSO57_1031414 [Entomophthora muscae]
MLCTEIKYLCQRLSNQDSLSSESDGKGEAEVTDVPSHTAHVCCPGLEEQTCVDCALALDHLAVMTNDVADRKNMLEREVQNLTYLIEAMNKQVAPLTSWATTLATHVNGIAGTFAVQQIQVNELVTVTTTTRDISGQNSSTLDTLEESLWLLWTRQLANVSDFEGIFHINVLKQGDNSHVGFLFTSPQSVFWVIARDRLEGIVIL